MTVRKGTKRGLPSGASVPNDVMEVRRRRVAEATLANVGPEQIARIRAKLAAMTPEQRAELTAKLGQIRMGRQIFAPPRKDPGPYENDTFGDLPAGRCGRPDVHDWHAVVNPDASFECTGDGGAYADWTTLRREIEQVVGPDRIADARAKLAQYLRDGGCACHIAPPCNWCTSMCCGEHWEICLGRPPHARPGTCCEDCPEDEPEAQR